MWQILVYWLVGCCVWEPFCKYFRIYKKVFQIKAWAWSFRLGHGRFLNRTLLLARIPRSVFPPLMVFIYDMFIFEQTCFFWQFLAFSLWLVYSSWNSACFCHIDVHFGLELSETGSRLIVATSALGQRIHFSLICSPVGHVMHTWWGMCICLCICACMNVDVRMCLCRCLCVFIYVYVCAYVCVVGATEDEQLRPTHHRPKVEKSTL